MKFSIEITETLQKTVIVDARTSDDAERRVINMYHGGKIELDAENLTDVEFATVP